MQRTSFKSRRVSAAAVCVPVALLTMGGMVAAAEGLLLASESFEYPEGTIGSQAGGSGWSGGWASALALTGSANLTVTANGLTQPPGYGFVPAGNYASGPAGGGLVAYRGLGSAIDLSIDQDYYLSVLTRRGATARSMSINLFTGTTTAATVGFGHSTGGQLNITRSGELSNGPTGVIGYDADINLAPSYLWILKIAAKSGSTPDEVYLRTYRSNPNPLSAPDADPTNWSMTWAGTTNAVQNTAIDRIGLAMGSGGTLNVDEIRIGTTWADVVPPVNTAWNVNADGNWSTSGNWSTVVPNSVGATVTFGSVIQESRTVTLDASAAAGIINFDSPHGYVITGSSTLTVSVSSGQGAINAVTGSHTISAPVSMNDDTTITTASVAGMVFGNSVSAVGKTVTKAGGGTIQVQNVAAAGLHIAEGTVTISSKASPMTPTGTSVVGSLSIAAGSALDLTNNALVVDYTGTSVLADVQGAIASGQLTSSQAGENRVMASGEASDLFAEPTGTFAGVTVDSSSVVAALTVSGDASLDGVVDSADFNLFVANYGLLSGARWTQADFDVDGKVTTLDFNALAGNFAAAVPGDGLLGSVVPEPASVAVLLAGLLLRRRRV